MNKSDAELHAKTIDAVIRYICMDINCNATPTIQVHVARNISNAVFQRSTFISCDESSA